MTPIELKSTLLSLAIEQKIKFLATLAHYLTVTARSVYPCQVPEPESLKKLQAINELVHTVTGHLISLINDDKDRYPDDVFCDILLEKADTADCQQDFIWAVEQSLMATPI